MASSVYLPPAMLYYTHDSISDEFSNGQDSLKETFQDLLYGDIDPDEIEDLEVMKYKGIHWVTAGNRRLYLYDKLAEIGRLEEVAVEIVRLDKRKLIRKMTTVNGGTSVEIRSDKYREYGDRLEDRLERIVQQWEWQGRPTHGYRRARNHRYYYY